MALINDPMNAQKFLFKDFNFGYKVTPRGAWNSIIDCAIPPSFDWQKNLLILSKKVNNDNIDEKKQDNHANRRLPGTIFFNNSNLNLISTSKFDQNR